MCKLSFLSLLALLFIALKLIHYITWSWWVVLLPFYLPWIYEAMWVGIVIWLIERRKHLSNNKSITDNRDYQK